MFIGGLSWQTSPGIDFIFIDFFHFISTFHEIMYNCQTSVREINPIFGDIYSRCKF